MPRGSRPHRTPERSPEEREQARAERTRQRIAAAAAERAPLPPPVPPPSEAVQPPPYNDQAPPQPAPAPPGPPDPPARGRLRGMPGGRMTGHRWRPRLAALLALLAAGALVWFCVSLFQPFAGDGSGRVIVEIPRGASASEIGSILARRGVVASALFFDVRAFIEGKRGDLHPGRFVLKHDMSYAAAIDVLSKPPPAVIVVKVVIPEGYTRLQIARLAQEDTLSGSYLAASRRSPLFDPAAYGAPRGTPDLEGFLFPATYDLTAGAPAARLVRQQLIAFRQRFATTLTRRAQRLGVTGYELLTVASMIEREARVERDRPLIAAVIYNRLRARMPLGIDATIYYALARREGVAAYERELSGADLAINSPYNTRLHAGLPPTPIANPGLASIEAAARPAHANYRYYVAAPDGCGAHVFSTTYARFHADAEAYAAAVQRNGGHAPACKRK